MSISYETQPTKLFGYFFYGPQNSKIIFYLLINISIVFWLDLGDQLESKIFRILCLIFNQRFLFVNMLWGGF